MGDSLHGLEAQLTAMGFGHAAVAQAIAATPNPDLSTVLQALVSHESEGGVGNSSNNGTKKDTTTTTKGNVHDAVSDGNSVASSDNGDDLDYDSCDEDDIVFYEDDDAEDYAPTQEDIRRHSHTVEDFQVWTESSVIEKQKETAGRISQVLAVPLHRAVVLLIAYRWSEDQLLSAWWSNPDQVAGRVGVETEEQRRHAPALLADQIYTCGICMDEEIKGDNMALMPCGHLFCKDCWQGNLGVCIKEGESILIECMAPKCNMKVPETTVRSIVDDETWAKYKYFEAKEFVSSNPYVRWCPAPGCSKAIRITEDSSNVVSCQCGLEFCFGCSEQPHLPATCDQVRRWKKKCSDDSETAHWIQANTKGCPGCLASIEKNGGCNHVTCSKCRHEFCWVCNGPWAEHKGNYSCNRYNEAEKSNQNASQRALSRYLHYYTRYMNHERSREFEGKIKFEAEEKMKEMQCFNGATWIDVQFIAKAADTLVMSRRILMYTYVYAFYLPEGADKNLFEFQQEAVEVSTEELSRLLKADIDEISKIDVLNMTQKVQSSVASLLADTRG